jgi:hypothetical protein
MIRPLIPPTWTHAPFNKAAQRVYMSATLGLGGDLECLTGRAKIKRLAIPEGWDRQGIGRRFFIFPSKSLSDDEALQLRRSLMRQAKRSLVLAPSNEAAEAVRKDVTANLQYPTFSADDLEGTKTPFTQSPQAVAIVANRYDGIDFPDDDCRLLFIEGLPRAANLQERFLMTRMGAQLLFSERVRTRVLQAVGRCTRGLNDYSAVVVTGEELPDYLTNPKRRSYFHPELQAELEFGIGQSTDVKVAAIKDNFRIFLDHQSEWEAANRQILEYRDRVTQKPYPVMDQLAEAVPFEIAYQRALWQGDFAVAFEHAREVLGVLDDKELRGYRALWHYLAGSAAASAARDGENGMEAHAQEHFGYAKRAAMGIPWLVELARGAGSVVSLKEQHDAVTMLQIERLEAQLASLGVLHNRAFTTREREIREGLNHPESFETAQVKLGEHLGFISGKRESDASPDPWWMIGSLCIVFEDHANAKPTGAIIDATKARQAASHPDWVKKNVPGAADAEVLAVLVSPAKLATEGALPVLGRFSYWALDDFRIWAENALLTVRELRRHFSEPGDLEWRARAATAFSAANLDGPGLVARLRQSPADKSLASET